MSDTDDPSAGLESETAGDVDYAEEIRHLEEKIALMDDIREIQKASKDLEILKLEAMGKTVEAMKLAKEHANVEEAAKSWDSIFASTMGISDSILKNSKLMKMWKGGTEGLKDSFARTFNCRKYRRISHIKSRRGFYRPRHGSG